jgi:hypothetical protein
VATQKKSIKELYLELHELEKNSKIKPRILPSENGVFLLDSNNPHDVEWYEDDDQTELFT